MASNSLEILAQNFHNLEGITLHERSKNFNFYLNEIVKIVISPEDRKMFVKLLEHRNKLEDVFYTRILLQLQESDGLLNILTGPHVCLRKMVLRSPLCLDVLKNNFDSVTSEEFSAKICYLVRLRILVRLGQIFQDDERLDNYYKIVKQKYGLHLAIHLLSACSFATVTEEMQKNRVLLNNKQLTKLYGRFPDFLEIYFDHLKENNFNKFNRFDKLIKLIAANDTDLYWKILNKHELDTKLSKRTTIKCVMQFKEEVLKNGEKYLKILNIDSTFSELTLEQVPLLYSKLFPKLFNDFKVDLVASADSNIIKRLTKRVHKKYQFLILNQVFKTVYNSDFLQHDELLTEAVLQIIPVNLREEIITKKMAKDGKDDWLVFYEQEKALSIIKEKIIKTTDPNKRRHLVNLLVKTCKVHNNIPRLAEVLNYIISRHRNEDAALFSTIFDELFEIDTDKFNGDHWDAINKLRKINLLNRQDNFYYSDYRMNNFIEGYWAYKIRNNLSIAEDVSTFIKKHYKDYYLSIFENKKYKSQRRIVIDILADIIPTLFKDFAKNPEFRNVGNLYLRIIVDHNGRHNKDKINMSKFPFLIKYISGTMDDIADEDNQRSYIFSILEDLRHIKEADVYKKVCDELWKSKPEFYEHKWEFFLKYHPQYIVDNYEQFYAHTWLHGYVYKFIENSQHYSHLGIPQLYFKKSEQMLRGPEFLGQNMKFNAAVRFIVNSDQFLTVTEQFLPTEQDGDEDANIVQIKKTLSEVLANYKNMQDILKLLMALSTSDYLKYCLQSIYKIAYNMPASKLTNFMSKIASGKISLRKHAMFIAVRMSEQAHVYETLKAVGLTEKDASIQKYLIKSTLGYFNQNPSETFFELLKEHCKLLTDYDSEGFDLLLIFNKIPIQYLSRYVEFLWEFTQNSNIDEVRDVKYKILQKLDEDLVKAFKPEFLNTLVKNCLKFEKDDANKMYTFVYRYIINGELENVSKRINFVVTQIPGRVNSQDVQLSQNLLQFTIGICEQLFKEHRKKNTNAKIVLAKFKEAWSQMYSIENNFEQVTALQFAAYCLETNDYIKTLLVQKMVPYLQLLLQKYDNYIIPNFATTFTKVFLKLMEIQELQDDEELFKFLLEFLQADCSLSIADKEYFVLHALPKTLPKSTIAKEMHLQILQTLENSKSISIRMCVPSYINNLEDKKEDTMDLCRPICNMRC